MSVTSGTTAGELCLEAAGVGPGDEVIVPPFSFIATATAVMRAGGTPVFVDVDDSWNLNPGLIEEAITEMFEQAGEDSPDLMEPVEATDA